MAVAAAIGLSFSCRAAPSDAIGEGAAKHRPDVVAIYFPGYHQDDHYDSWFGEGWNEWQLLLGAPQRFPHQHLMKPAWGPFDEADPHWMARQVALAADHRIDVFLFDWYWYSGVKILYRPLEQGFLRATNQNRLRFALMWANHDWRNYFPAPKDQEPPMLLPCRTSPRDFSRLMNYCGHTYFLKTNYWRVQGALYFSIFDVPSFIRQLGGPEATRKVLDGAREQIRATGLGPIHFGAFLGSPDTIPNLQKAGFDSVTTYNLTASGQASLAEHPLDNYPDLVARHAEFWRSMDTGFLPYLPILTVGWDCTPRWVKDSPFPPQHSSYPYGTVVVSNTPAEFGRLAVRCKPPDYLRRPSWSMPGTSGLKAVSCCPNPGLAPVSSKPLAGRSVSEQQVLRFYPRPAIAAETIYHETLMKTNSPNPSLTTRREFLKTTAAAAAALSAPTVIPGSALGAGTQPPPSERINLGIIGCGNMGTSNLSVCTKYPDVVVTAACDVWDARLEVVTEQFKTTCKGYRDYRELLQKKDLDAVIIATPPHWHTLQAIAACEAGKDVYLQKPMTLHLGESLAIRNAVNRHRRICQVGTQIHASDNYRRVVEFIRSGNLGPIGTVRTFNVMNQHPGGVGRSTDKTTAQSLGLDWNFWCGPAPLRPFNRTLARDAYYHSSWMDYSGGWTPGMAPHIIDLPVWALDLGFPLLTSAAGGRFVLQDDGDAYDHHEVLWKYPKLTMTWMSSLTNSYGFDLHGEPKPERRLGIYFHGANGTMYANYSMFKVVPEGDKMNGLAAPPKSIAASPGHEREWLDCIKTRTQPSCNPNYHVKVDVPIQLSLLSLKLGRSIRFDPVKEQIVGDAEAARLAVPDYRSPWKFPAKYLKA